MSLPRSNQDKELTMIPAVPNAVNSGSKYLVFRPYNSSSLWEEGNHHVLKHIDKGFYFKFNCLNEIKLIKNTLEDNGFLPQPFV